MRIRERTLPAGWYPETADEISAQFRQWEKVDEVPIRQDAVAGIVPHAGWFFSGKTAFRVLERINPDFDTLVLVGGHLPAHGEILCVPDDGFDTPAGILYPDTDLSGEIRKTVQFVTDLHADNSVEVLLPMIRYLFGDKKIVVFRVPPTEAAEKLAAGIKAAAAVLGRRIRVIGSTDLTHYGPAYGFTPHGAGEAGASWVRKTNDAEIIRELLALNLAEALFHARTHRSACSAGAAVTAAASARLHGCSEGTLVEYTSSLERHSADSFVGYAGIVYSQVVR